MAARVLVSICVPTYDRAELIEACIESCLIQDLDREADIEVIVGDDSANTRTAERVASAYGNDPRVRYERNVPSLGQARNVDSLFRRARGSKILLLHDDDFLEPDALAALLSTALGENADVVFGNQYLVDHAGVRDRAASERSNAEYGRTPDKAGLQTPTGVAGLTQMLPNDGWMADAELVRRVGYHHEYGTACDFVFGVQLSIAARRVAYTPTYVSSYRLTETSVSSTTSISVDSASVVAYTYLDNETWPEHLVDAATVAQRRLAPRVVSTLARENKPMAGAQVMLANVRSYRTAPARFAFHTGLLVRAGLRRMISYATQGR